MPLSSTSAASEMAASQQDPAEKAEEKQRMEGKPGVCGHSHLSPLSE